MMVYKCPKCNGVLEYHEQDLELGEHHVCIECGEIYPYGYATPESDKGQARASEGDGTEGDWLKRKYYYDACEFCSELEGCDIANITNEEKPHVWSCDTFHWDESKLQSPNNHAPYKMRGTDELSEGQARASEGDGTEGGSS